MTSDNKRDVPLPPFQADETAAMEATFPNGGPSQDTPFGTAWLWHAGLQDPIRNRTALDNLSVNPKVWGNYSEAAETLAGLAITRHAIESDVRPNELAYVKFTEYYGDNTTQAFHYALIENVWFLTMVKCGSSWFVWGLSHNYRPPPNEVYSQARAARNGHHRDEHTKPATAQ